jgi:hypothetical protein
MHAVLSKERHREHNLQTRLMTRSVETRRRSWKMQAQGHGPASLDGNRLVGALAGAARVQSILAPREWVSIFARCPWRNTGFDGGLRGLLDYIELIDG